PRAPGTVSGCRQDRNPKRAGYGRTRPGSRAAAIRASIDGEGSRPMLHIVSVSLLASLLTTTAPPAPSAPPAAETLALDHCALALGVLDDGEQAREHALALE